MNRIHILALIGPAAAILTFTGCVSNSTYVKSQKQVSELTSQLSDLTKKNQDLSQQLGQLNDRLSQASQQLDETKQTADQLAKEKAEQDQVVSSLQTEIQAGQVKISQLAGKLSINMVDKILFNSGSSKLNAAGEKVLLQVGRALKNVQGKRIWIGGHTDNVPISDSLKDKFASNWELSTARATSVARFLQDKAGLPGERLIAAGYGEYQPIADNSTAEGREQNRRIELLLVPENEKGPGGAAAAPVTTPPAR
ncbi:MAG TPA: OmpA family protein [Elusimicrobiota bacterium]|nr:OmpA family protein [Elusimicrobiota bacterium]